MDGHGQREGGQEGHQHGDSRDEIYSQVIRAGKRTYFFDIKATRANDYYLTITESKKRYNRDGRHYYEKHKLFLYKEDFEKFTGALDEVLAKISELRGEEEDHHDAPHTDHVPSNETQDELKTAPPAEVPEVDSSFTEVSFDDLGTE